MTTNFIYIPVQSQFVETEEALTKIVGSYFNALNNFGGERCNEENLNASQPLFYIMVTGGTEQLLLDLKTKRDQTNPDEPVYLIAHPTHNSLPASMEVLAKLQQIGRKGRIFYLNGAEDDAGLNQIKSTIQNLDVKHALNEMRIGLIGEPSDWLVASTPDLDIVNKTWGPTVVPIEMDKIISEIDNFSEDTINETLKSLKSDAEQINEPSNLDLINNVKIYLALKKLIEEYNLNAVTIRCFDLVLDIKTTGCFGLAQLNDEGYIAGCEGDLVSTVGMIWVNKILDQIPWMANPVQLDEKNNSLWLAHCTVPRSIVDNYSLRSHFESGLGVGIQGTFPKGPVTLLRIGGEKMEKIWFAEGDIIQTGNSEHLCRTQIEIKLTNGNVQELLNAPLGNHLILVKGHYADQLKDWWEMMIFQE